MSLKEEKLYPIKDTLRMNVPGEAFNRVIDFYRVDKPVQGSVVGGVSQKVKVTYRVVVRSDRGVVADRDTLGAAKALYAEFIDGWLDAGGRDAKPGLPDGQLVQPGR